MTDEFSGICVDREKLEETSTKIQMGGTERRIDQGPVRGVGSFPSDIGLCRNHVLLLTKGKETRNERRSDL